MAIGTEIEMTGVYSGKVTEAEMTGIDTMVAEVEMTETDSGKVAEAETIWTDTEKVILAEAGTTGTETETETETGTIKEIGRETGTVPTGETETTGTTGITMARDHN